MCVPHRGRLFLQRRVFRLDSFFTFTNLFLFVLYVFGWFYFIVFVLWDPPVGYLLFGPAALGMLCGCVGVVLCCVLCRFCWCLAYWLVVFLVCSGGVVDAHQPRSVQTFLFPHSIVSGAAKRCGANAANPTNFDEVKDQQQRDSALVCSAVCFLQCRV